MILLNSDLVQGFGGLIHSISYWFYQAYLFALGAHTDTLVFGNSSILQSLQNDRVARNEYAFGCLPPQYGRLCVCVCVCEW